MKLSIQIEGVPIVATERYEVGALARELARAVTDGKPLILTAESDSADLLLQSAEHFLTAGLTPATIADQYGNEFPSTVVLMPSHAKAEQELAELRKEHEALRVKCEDEKRAREKKIAEVAHSLRLKESEAATAKNGVDTWWGCCGAALLVCDQLESMLAGSATRWPRGLRKRLKEIREAHAEGA